MPQLIQFQTRSKYKNNISDLKLVSDSDWHWGLLQANGPIYTDPDPILDQCPVAHVSLRDIAEYCNWLSKEAGLSPCYSITDEQVKWLTPTEQEKRNGYRLPTEAEWEWIAREGSNPINFRFGNTDSSAHAGWCILNAGDEPLVDPHDLDAHRKSNLRYHPVRSKGLPLRGLFDLFGNGQEICWSLYQPYGSLIPFSEPATHDLQDRIIRLASRSSSPDEHSRFSFSRSFFQTLNKGDYQTGFRVVRNA